MITGFKSLLNIALASALLVACGAPVEAPKENNQSQLHFIENWPDSAACGFRKAMKPINVCVSSQASGADTEKQKQYTLRALTEWLGALRQVNGNVTDQVAFNCGADSLKLNVHAGNATATGGPGFINVYPTKQLGTHLHEWGHAFACLGDTYQGRQAGSCKPGHPESIMCWGEYGEDRLYDDDIKGVQKIFLQKFPSAPGTNTATPPVINNSSVVNIFVALSGPQRADNAAPQMLVSVPKTATRVFVCDGRITTSCRANTAGAVAMTRLAGEKAGRLLFISPFALTNPGLSNFVITAEDGASQPIVSRRMGFKQRP